MTPTWDSGEAPPSHQISTVGVLRMILRGLPLAILVFGCLAVLLLLRLIERPFFGRHRPWTPHITVFVCRNALRLIGLGFVSHGAPMTHPGALVANHSSWLDIFSLNAAGPLYFVSKSEVAKWPGIGWLARATGTVFVRRARSEAAAQKKMFENRFRDGHKLLFFPEGTSTDGQRVLSFKPTLFAALYGDDVGELWVQPVTVVYQAPAGEDDRFYAWWGDMSFGPHLMKLLATSKHGRVELTWHDPTKVTDHGDRKQLAKAVEKDVRMAHPQGEAPGA